MAAPPCTPQNCHMPGPPSSAGYQALQKMDTRLFAFAIATLCSYMKDEHLHAHHSEQHKVLAGSKSESI